MGKFIDLTGMQFGRLTVLSHAGLKNGKTYWNCSCSCGNTTCNERGNLTNGRIKSCGCLHCARIVKHGYSTRENIARVYNIWISIHQRCENPSNLMYPRYGAKDIKVCTEWDDFIGFLEDMGEPDDGQFLNRIDKNKDYSKENCVWGKEREQMGDCPKFKQTLIEFGGKTQNIKEWAEEKGIKYTTLHNRLKSPLWTVEQALNTNTNSKKSPSIN